MQTISLEDAWVVLHRDFYVSDILLPSASVIFLLESPHIQELKFGAPVSGPSGGTMSKHLFGETYAKFPLGRLVKKNVDEQKNRPTLDRIGLMNVCNVPMQRVAYGRHPLEASCVSLISAFEGIRSENQRDHYRDPWLNQVQQRLVDHLQTKLLTLTERAITFVPCGRFAQKFFRLAQVQSQRWTVINEVPHPSYNSWDRSQYAPQVRAVHAALHHDSGTVG